jgi:hypothetical protein
MPNRFWLVAAIFFSCQNLVIAADHYTTLYYGHYTDDAFGDIISGHPIKYEDSYIGVIAHAFTLFPKKPTYQWELEGQLVKHTGEQTHWEFNFAVILRRTAFPWNQYIKTTAAIGDGLSYATVVPPIELASHTNRGATKLLNYFMVELTFAPPQSKHWSLMTRIHHRSGIYGLFDDVKGGSNLMSIGLRYKY